MLKIAVYVIAFSALLLAQSGSSSISGNVKDASISPVPEGSDVPHHVVLTLLYELHKFKGNRLLNAALGGWKVGLLETYESGPVFTVITAANTTNAFPAGSLRPN